MSPPIVVGRKLEANRPAKVISRLSRRRTAARAPRSRLCQRRGDGKPGADGQCQRYPEAKPSDSRKEMNDLFPILVRKKIHEQPDAEHRAGDAQHS